jgi:hypothetical protein
MALPGPQPQRRNRHGLRRHTGKGAVNFIAPVYTPRRWSFLHNRMVPAVLRFSAESGQVLKRLDTREEEISAAFYGRESGQALNLSSDWALRNSYVVAAVLSADYRITLVA